MTPADLATVAAELNKLPFVTWDRFTEIADGDIDVYGWIDREDGRSDFVTLTFPTPVEPGYVGFNTSSAAYSEQIADLLHGHHGEHVACQRVDGVFGDLVERKTVLA